MHQIRRQAKYAAWYSEPNEEDKLFGSKNPFSRYRPPTVTPSEEPERGGRFKLKRARPLSEYDTQPEAEVNSKRKKFTVMAQVRATIFNSWFNLLFAFSPAGFAVYYAHANSRTVFAINFISIFPSSAMLSYGVDEIGLRLGDVVGGLLSNTFSNAAQLISSILLLKSRQIQVLQSMLVGSMLSNLLLMTGLSFFFGGLNRLEQYFTVALARTISMLLLLAVLALVIPTASQTLTKTSTHDVVIQSRGTSIVIMLSYVLWLFFQLKTNRSMFDVPPQHSAKLKKKEENKKAEDIVSIPLTAGNSEMLQTPQKEQIRDLKEDKNGVQIGSETEVEVRIGPDDEEELKEPGLSFFVALAVVALSATLLGFNTEFSTNSIQGLTQEAGISQAFVGLVILPVISNDYTSIFVAVKDKMDMSLTLTLERCMQTALMVVPLTVIIAWWMGIENMTLDFEAFPTTALFAAIILVTYVMLEGKSNWLVGALLVKVYIIIALATYFTR